MDILFRRGEPGDLEQIADMACQAARYMEEQGIRQWDELYPHRDDFEADIRRGQLSVGICDGEIAVVFTLSRECDEDYREGCWRYPREPFLVLHRLCVRPTMQNRGIARAAIRQMEGMVRESGIRAVRLDVFSGNLHARRLYTGLGYQQTGEVTWRKGRFILMEKYLEPLPQYACPGTREGVEMEEKREYFPDGTPVAPWFYDTGIPKPEEMGRQYVLTQYGILDDGRIHTAEIQSLIDRAAGDGGGVIVVPAGTYLTGSLFFRQGVNLYVAEGGTLKGSDDPADYEIRKTRIEGETCLYFTALINAQGLQGFTMCGPGTIDGNGLRAWKAFWLRRSWNPACTNKDEQRPRLVYLSDCRDVLVAGLKLQNAQFWTNHIYRCNRVKFLNCRIFSPYEPVKAPSTDAIDIDVCTDVLVKNCYMHVNDDSVVLKGGKGPWADQAKENGSNERIIVEDCVYGFCHGCLTCGSESVHNRNIVVRRIKVLSGYNLLWLKMRPDTPQHYEYVTVEDVQGKVENFININPWTQFYDLKGRKDIPLSYADHIVMRGCVCECDTFFNVEANEGQYQLSDFIFEDLRITAKEDRFDADIIRNMTVKNVRVEKLQPSVG